MTTATHRLPHFATPADRCPRIERRRIDASEARSARTVTRAVALRLPAPVDLGLWTAWLVAAIALSVAGWIASQDGQLRLGFWLVLGLIWAPAWLLGRLVAIRRYGPLR